MGIHVRDKSGEKDGRRRLMDTDVMGCRMGVVGRKAEGGMLVTGEGEGRRALAKTGE